VRLTWWFKSSPNHELYLLKASSDARKQYMMCISEGEEIFLLHTDWDFYSKIRSNQ